MIHIILYGTEDPGNIGAICRLMGNFGFEHLLFIEPQCNPLDLVARKRAKHAKVLLEKAPLVTVDVLDQFDVLIGTSARQGGKKNIRRKFMEPHALHEVLHNDKHIGIVFGPESTGLPNEVIDKCHILTHIPTHENYPSMNLSHAVGTILYEISKKSETKKKSAISSKTVKRIEEGIASCVEEVVPTQVSQDSQNIMWRRILATTNLNETEAKMVLGFFLAMEKRIKSDRPLQDDVPHQK